MKNFRDVTRIYDDRITPMERFQDAMAAVAWLVGVLGFGALAFGVTG